MSRRALLLLVACLLPACQQSGTPVAVTPSAEETTPEPSRPPIIVPSTLPTLPVDEPSLPPPTVAGSTTYAFPIRPTAGVSYARSHHDYPAADIFAPCGRAVVSPVAGRVDEVSRVDPWQSSVDDPATRGGLSISVVGDDGVRYYGSHLQAIAADVGPGGRVAAGHPLGTVGNSGNARGIACHLHFGISPPRGPGDWQVRRGVVYPWPYLDSWKAGGQKSPAPAVTAWAKANP